MKKGILLLLGIMTIATVKANDIKTPTSKIGVNYNYSDAISFIERGIKFHVFLNGDFDFNTNYRAPKYVHYNGVRTSINRRVRIERDYRGRVRRVGNAFINYDRRGNVKRIGSVYMRYNRGNLYKVGNLKIKYDRWGNPRFYGKVKHNRYNNYYYNNEFSFDITIGDICDYDDAYFYRRDFNNNYNKFKEDSNFYYYRAKPNAKIGKRNKIIKRRKATSSYYKNKKSKRNITTKGIYSNDLRKKKEYKKRTIEKGKEKRKRRG